MKLKPSKPFFVGLAAGLVLAVAVGGLRARLPVEEQQPDHPPPRPAMTVTTATPRHVELPLRFAANGNIAAWQEASIGTEAGGLRLAEVRVNVGDAVRAGEVLAVFDDATVRADLAQARAALAEAEAAAAEAVANAERARAVQAEASGALSAQLVAQYLTAEQTTRARIEAARATLAVRELRLAQTRVLAPDSGVISARDATVGAVPGAGVELFRMIRQGRLEWRAEVTAVELERIRVGEQVALSAADGTRIEGRVRMVAPTVNPQTRAALVYVDLPLDGTTVLKAGMFVRGEFDLGSAGALILPQQAVVVREAFSYVFRLGDDGRVAQIKVRTGRRSGGQVEIVDGVSADTRGVVDGAGFLNDGDLVHVVDPSAMPAPDGAAAGDPAHAATAPAAREAVR